MKKSEQKINTFPFEFFAVCIDDSRPNFNVNMWIQKGQIYKTTFDTLVKNVIDDENAFIWEDMHGNIIIPNEKLDCHHIKMKRFQQVFLPSSLN